MTNKIKIVIKKILDNSDGFLLQNNSEQLIQFVIDNKIDISLISQSIGNSCDICSYIEICRKIEIPNNKNICHTSSSIELPFKTKNVVLESYDHFSWRRQPEINDFIKENYNLYNIFIETDIIGAHPEFPSDRESMVTNLINTIPKEYIDILEYKSLPPRK